MQKPKKIPLRKCLGCGEMKEKRELVRVVRSQEGVIAIDPVGKSNGRGAYLCHSADCLKAARKARRLERALQSKIPDDVYDALEREFADEQA